MIIEVIKLKRGTCHINLLKFYPGLAQFGRAPDLGSGGRGFKSRISDQPNEACYRYFITAYTNNFGVMPDRQGVVFSLPISRYSSVGRTLVWGTRGRRFKSCYFDHCLLRANKRTISESSGCDRQKKIGTHSNFILLKNNYRFESDTSRIG